MVASAKTKSSSDWRKTKGFVALIASSAANFRQGGSDLERPFAMKFVRHGSGSGVRTIAPRHDRIEVS
jgi:hypothetical protein